MLVSLLVQNNNKGVSWWRVNERGIMGVVVFTSTADGKQSKGTRAQIMFMDELSAKLT